MIRAILLCAALAGCATTAPEQIVRTVEVPKLVTVPCAVKLEPYPQDATAQKPAAEDIFQAMQRALATISRWEAWAKTTKAAVAGCQTN